MTIETIILVFGLVAGLASLALVVVTVLTGERRKGLPTLTLFGLLLTLCAAIGLGWF